MDKDLRVLLEPDSELMSVFKEKAPGTYRHCEAVANLVDAVCAALDSVDRSIVYPAARLHDIGKTVNPGAFCENQGDTNIHDKLDPFVSYQLISRHVSDSVLLLLQYDIIPRSVIEVVGQHHGNTVIKSICSKDSSNNPDDFRYPSSPPSTIEACVLMVCDVAEAGMRSFFTKGSITEKKSISDLLNRLIEEGLVKDKQLDTLRIGDLRIIKEALIDEFTNLYHKRVDYDDDTPSSGKEVLQSIKEVSSGSKS